MEKYEQLESGIYIPSLSNETDNQAREMVESPMMQFLMLNVFNAWARQEGNYKTAWHSPVYAQLALVQDTAMHGVKLIQEADYVPQSKGWAVTSLLARGVSLARLSCLALDMGSFSDAFANFRMLLEREMVLRYLEANNQYDAFAKASYAELYHRAGKGINDKELRKGYTSSAAKESRRMMELIRTEYFANDSPRAPGHYWRRPKSQELADEYAKGLSSRSGKARARAAIRAYKLGNRSVHPGIRDMLQPEDSDISAEDLRGLILLTLVDLATFSLSRFQESSSLANKIERIILQPPSGAPIIDMLLAENTSA